MTVAFKLIVAVCENMGIGKNANLPWRLKSEMAYFTRMTTTCEDAGKKNIVIMGRKTWDSIPKKYKPLNDRINFVLSRSDLDFEENSDVYHFKDLNSVIMKLEDPNFKTVYESVWVIGGSQVYDICMKSECFYRLYITKIMKDFECDTFFPKLPLNLKEISDSDVPEGIQEEGAIQYIINVYENPNYAAST